MRISLYSRFPEEVKFAETTQTTTADAYLQALRQVGYDGFLTIEREVGADPQGDIAAAIAFLQSKL